MESKYVCNCGEKYRNQNDLDKHEENCKNRSHSCVVCNEKVKSQDMKDHLHQCGNKTSKCPNCQRYIQRAIYHHHLENNCITLAEDNPSDAVYSMLDRRNDTQMEDNVVIPCEFCNKQIKCSDYSFHIENCFQNENHYRLHFPRSTADHSTNEQGSNTTSTTNEKTNIHSTISSIQEEPHAINRSFQRLDLNSDRNLINNSANDKPVSKETAVSLLHDKAAHVQDTLSKDYYLTEVNHVTEKLQFNIVLAGSPRVGKSQLINALCDGENLAETSPSLNSCTKEIKCYTLEDNQQRTPGVKPFKINFFDTPGIESWTNEGGKISMMKLIEEKVPLCFIYCAAPGSFADLEQLRPILELCQRKEIFCALVCTNMWANPSRKDVMKDFEKALQCFGTQVKKSFDQGKDRPKHQVTLFGHGALCTMVNSVEYYDPEFSSVRKPVQGIDELIHCIMEELDQEKLLGWCNTVLYRRSFWEKISQKVNGFYSTNLPIVNNLLNKTNDQIGLQFVVRLFNIIRERRV